MDGQLVWKDEYNIGVDIIDQEHKRLFKIINKLFRFSDEKSKSQWACQEGIKFFKDHAVKHFAEEENYMASINYERLKVHRHIHSEFRERTLPALEEELEKTKYCTDSVEHFLGVCAGWLVGHTLMEDRAITGKGRSRWIGLLQEKEQEAMKKIILQLMYDLFHLESYVISDAYGGEKFGKGVYHRLVYGTEKEEEKYEIFLVFEEKLLINTVGKSMGIKTNKLNTLLMNASRYMARQFAEHVKNHLSDMEGYELKEENLLTYEQFQDVFENERLQLSLLFDTGEGYFSYCTSAGHPSKKGNVAPLRMDNAMAEVEKYIMQRESHWKWKVLVVDDSVTVRQGIKNLLAEDYDVALAQSGTAALRCMILDKPDLVLLDYEMPVCDGQQVLKMMRSEETFADIPIIFLTGRADPETVKKLVALKPDGYLVKYLKPEQIKQKIDEYFERQNIN
ncbi:response regulator [Lachnospiraceae bacterium WCA-9-b2]|uniref:Stage 0 sporulation protein A homolog n=1 Tax=Sporofaciens musculi TaxID=2681861 RepID=A0A7X3MKQ2_9FIRM|nr:hemerythrin domain-containing protein [Sporofaciens musculi]MXP78142.1 response regulator [Sporofaciens musculi]